MKNLISSNPNKTFDQRKKIGLSQPLQTHSLKLRIRKDQPEKKKDQPLYSKHKKTPLQTTSEPFFQIISF